MTSSESHSELVIVAKHLEPSVVNRKPEYPRLPHGTKVLVTSALGQAGAVTEAAISRLAAAGCRVSVLGHRGDKVGGIHGSADVGVNETIQVFQGTTASREDCENAVRRHDVVIHTIGPNLHHCKLADGTSEQLVGGTKNVVEAAAAAGVKSFVFASSASVVFVGQELRAASEDIPYPAPHMDRLSAALADAEKIVLCAENPAVGTVSDSKMLTCIVRAATVYGPGEADDLLTGLVSRARKPNVVCPVRVGDGNNVVDLVYSGNVAHALVLAMQRLIVLQSPCTESLTTSAVSRTFTVTDDEPVPFGDFTGRVLSGLGYPPPSAGMSLGLAVVLSFLFRILAVVLSPILEFRSALTPRRIAEEGTTWYFDISRAKKELGYAPLWTQEEGLSMTLQDSESLRNPQATVRHLGPFTPDDVARHCSEDDAWIIVDDKVYDVTPYLEQHPGGDAILRNAGGDSSEGFHSPQHPVQAKEILDRYFIGDLLKPSS